VPTVRQQSQNRTQAASVLAVADPGTIPPAQVQPDWNASSGMGQILNKPTIPAAQVQTDWNAVSGLGVLANKPTIPAAQIASDWSQGNTAALDFIKNKPSLVTGVVRVFSNGVVSRTIQTVAASANGFQLSASRDAVASYSVTITTSITLLGSSGGYVVLEVCPTNSAVAANWVEVARVASAQGGTVVVGITLNQTGGGHIQAIVPAGYYVRIRSVNSTGTPTFTLTPGQEILI
jgi:hypothetical protein